MLRQKRLSRLPRFMPLVALFLLFLSACLDREPPEQRATLFVFGTLVEIVVRGADPSTATKAIAEIDSHFRQLHTDWHAWQPGELGQLNQAIAEGRKITVSDPLLRLIKESQQQEALSEGLFNPAIGELIAVWGFHTDLPPEGAPLPDPALIDQMIASTPSLQDLRIDGNRISSINRSVRLDFGGNAKGAAMRDAMTILRRNGIHRAIINAGGGLMVMGDHGDRPWRAGVRDPVDWGIVGSLDLKDGEAMMTSGNYERFRKQDGHTYAHILDPRTGWPVENVASVSVLAADPALADAASTALTVAGPTEWVQIASSMGITHVLMIEADGTVHATPEMANRIQFKNPPKKLLIESVSSDNPLFVGFATQHTSSYNH